MSFEKETKRDLFFAAMEQEMMELLDPATGAPKKELVEATPCPVCGNTGAPFVKKWGFTYDRCSSCSAVFVNPRLREDAVIELYKKGSKANELWATAVHQSDAQRKINEKYFLEQVELIRSFKAGGKLLDVGCGEGSFLEHAARVYDSLGLEIDEQAVDIATKKGLTVKPLLLNDPSLDSTRYDVVTLYGVLEHLFNPRPEMDRIRQLLNPGGLFVAVTPNAFSLVGMLLHGSARFYTPRNHPVIYSERPIRRLMKEAGFEVLRLDTVLSGYDSIVNSIQYREPFGDVAFDDIPEKLRTLVSNRTEFESLLHAFNLGLRIRVIAKKIDG